MTTVERVNELLSPEECRIQSFGGCRLLIIWGFDLSYYHDLEMEFVEVSYVQCPMSFYAKAFRLATSAELERIGQWIHSHIDPTDSVFCFEDSDCEGNCFFIAAQSLEIREGRVLHYTP